MANKVTNTDNYSAIAAAIRAKNGASDTYTPAQMAAAIAAIPTGEQIPEPVTMKAHNFYDYDGTLLMSFSAEEVAEMTELPTPTIHHSGLVFDGWNWTLEEVQAAPFSMVGAHYRTDDGATRIVIEVNSVANTGNQCGRLTLRYRGVEADGSVLIDWGDGTQPGTFEVYHNSISDITHLYKKVGIYTIAITPVNPTFLYSQPMASSYYYDAVDRSIWYREYYYGANERIVPANASYTFGCYGRSEAIKKVAFQRDASTINAVAVEMGYLESCSGLVIPRSIPSIAARNSVKYGKAILTHPLMTAIPGYFVYDQRAVKFICIPRSVVSCAAYALYASNLYAAIVFLPETPPEIASNTFYTSSMRSYVYVPDNSVDAYKAATNWSKISSYIRPISRLISALEGGAS